MWAPASSAGVKHVILDEDTIVVTDSKEDLKSQVKFNMFSNDAPMIVKSNPDCADKADGIAEKTRTSSVKRYFVVLDVSAE